MSLSNALMYEGRLECGSERTAIAVLQLPSRAQVEKELDLYVCEPQYSAWVQAALEPSNPVCFLDTSVVSLAFCFASNLSCVESHRMHFIHVYFARFLPQRPWRRVESVTRLKPSWSKPLSLCC